MHKWTSFVIYLFMYMYSYDVYVYSYDVHACIQGVSEKNGWRSMKIKAKHPVFFLRHLVHVYNRIIMY